MTSALLDESIMAACLDPKAAPLKDDDAAKRLRTGALMLMLDAWDRNATRDQFCAAVGAAVGLSDVVARHEMMLNIKTFWVEQGGDISPADMEVTLAALAEKISYYTEQCAKMAVMLMKCANDDDPVH